MVGLAEEEEMNDWGSRLDDRNNKHDRKKTNIHDIADLIEACQTSAIHGL